MSVYITLSQRYCMFFVFMYSTYLYYLIVSNILLLRWHIVHLTVHKTREIEMFTKTIYNNVIIDLSDVLKKQTNTITAGGTSQ